MDLLYMFPEEQWYHHLLLESLMKMFVDTGTIRVYLPSIIAEQLFSQDELKNKYEKLGAINPTAPEKSQIAWRLKSPHEISEPVHFRFAGSKVEWPMSLKLSGDEYSVVMVPGKGTGPMLGLSFLIQLKGVIFDFTEGKERVGFISREKVQPEKEFGNRPRDRLLQFVVGGSIGLGLVMAWRLYCGT